MTPKSSQRTLRMGCGEPLAGACRQRESQRVAPRAPQGAEPGQAPRREKDR